MSENNMTAHRQWLTRPADERFQTLDALEAAVLARKDRSVERTAKLGSFHVDPTADGDLVFANGGGAVNFSNWSFQQLCTKLRAPRDYMARLPANLAATCLNQNIQERAEEDIQLLGFDGGLRAVTSDAYARIWDLDVVKLVRRMIDGTNFTNPMEYENGKFGAPKVPGGLYSGDRDCFLLFEDKTKVIEVDGERLHRSMMWTNSEVGSSVLSASFMLLREICGNLILWGARSCFAFKVKHMGDIQTRVAHRVTNDLPAFLNASALPDVEKIRKSKLFSEWKTDAEAVEWLTEKADFTKPMARVTVATAQEEEGDAANLWRLVNGLTAYARRQGHMDTTFALAKKAGELIDKFVV